MEHYDEVSHEELVQPSQQKVLLLFFYFVLFWLCEDIVIERINCRYQF